MSDRPKELLDDMGTEIQRRVMAAELVTAFVTGFVIGEQERAQSAAPRYDLDGRTRVVGDRFPLVRKAGGLLDTDPQGRFEDHPDVIVRGIAALVDVGSLTARGTRRRAPRTGPRS